MREKSNISKAILQKLQNKQAVKTSVLEDNILGVINSSEIKKSNPVYAINRSIKNLEENGFIEKLSSENELYLRLTEKGKQKAHSQNLDHEKTLVDTSWDGYFRIIILDLPENRKQEREALRYLLKKANFICIKNSVWISLMPYEHLFTNIKKDLGLTTEIMIIVTNQIDETTRNEFLKNFV